VQRLFLLFLIFIFPVISSAQMTIKEARQEVVRKTMDYLAIPYLWGGQHPQTGLDCSGFVQLVFEDVGLDLPRVSRDQFRATEYLTPQNVLPGDLIFFAMKNPGSKKVDHVGIYVGKGFFVHASFTNGIHIDPITSPYYYERLVGIRKYKGF
jgi:cell wall-associated NlpC family hydrolase